jgi:hypothetical protein
MGETEERGKQKEAGTMSNIHHKTTNNNDTQSNPPNARFGLGGRCFCLPVDEVSTTSQAPLETSSNGASQSSSERAEVNAATQNSVVQTATSTTLRTQARAKSSPGPSSVTVTYYDDSEVLSRSVVIRLNGKNGEFSSIPVKTQKGESKLPLEEFRVRTATTDMMRGLLSPLIAIDMNAYV